MTTLLILFAISLMSMSILIGRKILVLRRAEIGEVIVSEEITIEGPSIEEVRAVTVHKVKKIGYVGLVTSIRLYFRSTNFIKNKYSVLKEKVRNTYNKNSSENKETSKFLKVISEYKYKIRDLKHKIKEEEESL